LWRQGLLWLRLLLLLLLMLGLLLLLLLLLVVVLLLVQLRPLLLPLLVPLPLLRRCDVPIVASLGTNGEPTVTVCGIRRACLLGPQMLAAEVQLLALVGLRLVLVVVSVELKAMQALACRRCSTTNGLFPLRRRSWRWCGRRISGGSCWTIVRQRCSDTLPFHNELAELCLQLLAMPRDQATVEVDSPPPAAAAAAPVQVSWKDFSPPPTHRVK
jgi:hypothetical protein